MAKIDLEKLICSLAERNIFLRDALKEQGLEYKDGEIVEVQKSKFKVGDWVVRKDGKIAIIYDLQKTSYVGHYTDGTDFVCKYSDEHLLHHWTIADARDGDVLVVPHIEGSEHSEQIFIFKEIKDREYAKNAVEYYCRYLDGEFRTNEHGFMGQADDYFTPATKEQRDLLFAKMKEAGYEWDADKKELKKIDNRFDYEHANIQQKDFAPKTSTANRQVYNRAILAVLSTYVEKYPDTRFGQMLCNLDVNPHFDEESRETYWNLCKIINKQRMEARIKARIKETDN